MRIQGEKGGADAALQLLNFKCVWPLTVGEGIGILFGLLLITALLRTVLAMLLSECFRSSTVPLALMSGSPSHLPAAWHRSCHMVSSAV